MKLEETVGAILNSNFDEFDLALVKIIKGKYVRHQLYDVAAQLRDIEKDMLTRIEEQAKQKNENEAKKILESLEFGKYLLDNFTDVSWWIENAEGKPDVCVSAYIKKDDKKVDGIPKKYTVEDAFGLFRLTKLQERLHKSIASKENIS